MVTASWRCSIIESRAKEQTDKVASGCTLAKAEIMLPELWNIKGGMQDVLSHGKMLSKILLGKKYLGRDGKGKGSKERLRKRKSEKGDMDMKKPDDDDDDDDDQPPVPKEARSMVKVRPN